MFGNIKKKLTSAIQEGIIISESLQQQYKQRKPSTPETTPSIIESTASSRSSENLSMIGELDLSSDIDFTVGCSLLNKYENDWKAIHDANEEAADMAENVATQIEAIDKRINEHSLLLTDMNACLSKVPELVQKVRDSMTTLQAITALSETIESEMDKLENLCEECDLQSFMLQKQCELSQHKQKKMVELESYRQKVASDHQAKIREFEERLRTVQRERQAVFEGAFFEDMQEYKQKGTLPKFEKGSSIEVALEEVDLGDDVETKDALEDFLNGG